MEQTVDFLNTMAAHLGKTWKMSSPVCQATIRSENAETGQKVVKLTYLLLDQSDPLSVSVSVQEDPLKGPSTEAPSLAPHVSSGDNPAYLVSIDKAMFGVQQGTVPGPPVEWSAVVARSGPDTLVKLGVVRSVSTTDFVLNTGTEGLIHIPFDRHTVIYGPAGVLYQYNPPTRKKKMEDPVPPLTSFMRVGDPVSALKYFGGGDSYHDLTISIEPQTDDSKRRADDLERDAHSDPEALRSETQHPAPGWQPLVLLTGLDKETAERIAKATVHALVLCQKNKAPSPF